MASKVKTESKVPVLKGQEAEDKVLQYLKAMNRPYGAVDVAANLKGAVQKTNVQKILVALAEKGELVQKTYGKTTFFVVNQSRLEIVPAEKLASLESELKTIEEENTILTGEVKALTAELAKVKSTPTDEEVEQQVAALREEIAQVELRLQPLRSGAPPISAGELQTMHCEWEKGKGEWFRRRKVFNDLWSMATDPLSPQESGTLEEELGIEKDTPEHEALERGPLCTLKTLKRKRP